MKFRSRLFPVRTAEPLSLQGINGMAGVSGTNPKLLFDLPLEHNASVAVCLGGNRYGALGSRYCSALQKPLFQRYGKTARIAVLGKLAFCFFRRH